MNNDEVFLPLSVLPRWVPYKLSAKKDGSGKKDKIPHNGRNGLSTATEADWTDLVSAITTVKEQYGLSGVGFVMTGGIELDGWTLIGFDFDGVTPEWTPPFKTYAETSPSGAGARSFAWVPSDWARQFQDTLDTTPPGCDHCEIYLGTAPRFLTVTFDSINHEPIAKLKGADLLLIKSWGMHLHEAPKPETATPSFDVEGTAVDLTNPKFRFTKDQRRLLAGVGQPEIDRNKVMMGFLVKLIDFGITKEDILATMLTDPALLQYLMDHRNNNEDKAVEFAKEEINRAYDKSFKGKRANLASFNSDWKEVKPVTTSEVNDPVSASAAFPMELYTKAPGLVGEIARHVMHASHSPREEFAYAVALSVVACLVGPYCQSDAGKLNLFIVLVGGTGTGKTEAIKAGLNSIFETDAKDSVCDFPASEAAMRRQLGVNPNILIRVDELAAKFESIKGGDENGIGRALLEAFDSAYMPPKPYADEKKSLPAVENPFVQIMAGTTEKIFDVLQTKHLGDGTLNRFVFVYLQEEPEYRNNEDPLISMPKELKDKLNAFLRAGRMADLVGDVPGFGRRITLCKEVKDALKNLGPEIYKKQQDENGELFSRFKQYVGKIASILAVSDGRNVVGMRDYQHALAFMTWSVGTTHSKVGGALSGSDFEKKMKRIMRKLSKTKDKRMSMRELYRYMTCSRKDMEVLIEAMALSGTVSEDDDWVSLLE